jgi:hypothetical protein
MQVGFLLFVYMCIAVGDPIIKRMMIDIQLWSVEHLDITKVQNTV